MQNLVRTFACCIAFGDFATSGMSEGAEPLAASVAFDQLSTLDDALAVAELDLDQAEQQPDLERSLARYTAIESLVFSRQISAVNKLATAESVRWMYLRRIYENLAIRARKAPEQESYQFLRVLQSLDRRDNRWSGDSPWELVAGRYGFGTIPVTKLCDAFGDGGSPAPFGEVKVVGDIAFVGESSGFVRAINLNGRSESDRIVSTMRLGRPFVGFSQSCVTAEPVALTSDGCFYRVQTDSVCKLDSDVAIDGVTRFIDLGGRSSLSLASGSIRAVGVTLPADITRIPHRVVSLDFSCGDRRAVLATNNGELSAFELDKPDVLWTLDRFDIFPVDVIAAASGAYVLGNDHAAFVHEGVVVRRWSTQIGMPERSRLSDDTKLLAIASRRDGAIVVLDCGSDRRVLWVHVSDVGVTSVGWWGRNVIATCSDGTTYLLDLLANDWKPSQKRSNP